jgi:hypothetical protein
MYGASLEDPAENRQALDIKGITQDEERITVI